MGTDFRKSDTDGDNLSDYFEVNRDGNPNTYQVGVDTNPRNWDTDGDQIGDMQDQEPLIFNEPPTYEDTVEDIPFLPVWAYPLFVGCIGIGYRRMTKQRQQHSQ